MANGVNQWGPVTHSLNNISQRGTDQMLHSSQLYPVASQPAVPDPMGQPQSFHSTQHPVIQPHFMHSPQPKNKPQSNHWGHRHTMSLSSISGGPTPSSAHPRQIASWYPDVYTAPFVPEYLRTVNTLPAQIWRATPPPSVNFQAFMQNFCGNSFLRPLPLIARGLRSGTGSQNNVKLVAGAGEAVADNGEVGDNGESLRPNNYSQYFSVLLETEIKALDRHVKNFNLFSVPIAIHDPHQWHFRLEVPGIRENMPPVQLGDMIKLRQIRPAAYPFAGGFTGHEYETFVFGMDRTEGYVVIRADHLWIDPGGKFNIIFGVQERLWEGALRAISDVGTQLSTYSNKETSNGEPMSVSQEPSVSASNQQSDFLRRMLFPHEGDCEIQTKLNRGVFNRKWFDKELNYEQQKAVDSVLKQDYGNIPFLISGPPGTGKTKTVVETALQLIYAPTTPKHHVLLCAPSQEAADTLALRLIPHFNPNALLRLQQTSRTFQEVPSSLLTYSHIENDMFSIPSWQRLMRFRIVVCSCRDADMLVQARCTNRDLGRWEKAVVDSLRGVSEGEAGFVERGESVRLHWSVLLLDEAAQGIEPEVAIPLSVVAPPEEASTDRPIVVMAGDQMQLGPRTQSKGPLEKSVFERIFSRAVYSKHPLSRDVYSDFGKEEKLFRGNLETYNYEQILSNRLPYPRPPFANLLRNYRSHSAILAVPSALFYNDTLIPEALGTDSLNKWKGWCGNRSMPVKFILNSGLDESHEEGLSFYNLREVQITLETVASLLNTIFWDVCLPIIQEEIAVMSPYREQVRRIRKELRNQGFRKVNVGPVEAYQGSEHRFVIICTTRARERFLQKDFEKGIGLVNEPRRVNVAMTRAKAGLVVIGNPWILERDVVWNEWMSFAWRHDAIQKDPTEAPQSSGEAPSANLVSPALSADSTPVTKFSIAEVSATAGRTKPVNEWKPRGGEAERFNSISRLETALVYRSKAREGAVFGQNGGWDEDDPMFLAGIAAEEAVREADELGLGIGF